MAAKGKLVGEFKKFINRGNVMDLAVGIIIGGAFTAIARSLVNDIIMPLVGLLAGGVNFTNLRIVLRKATPELPELALTYGNFLQSVIDFLLIAVVVFMMVKSLNKLYELKERMENERLEEQQVQPSPSAVPPDIELLTEIRDLLKKNTQ